MPKVKPETKPNKHPEKSAVRGKPQVLGGSTVPVMPCNCGKC